MLDTGSEDIWFTGGTSSDDCRNCPNLSRFRADRSSTFERLSEEDNVTLDYAQGTIFSEKVRDSVLTRPSEAQAD
jgi:hypothetical protein